MALTQIKENVDYIQELSEIDGPFQSPIDIIFQDLCLIELPSLVWSTEEEGPKKMKITNNGHTVILSGKWRHERPYLTGGPLTGNYVFSQVHFHWGGSNTDGSEHTINGEGFPMEMHVVHFKKDYLTQESALREKDGVVVVVYFFQLQKEPNLSLQHIIRSLSEIKQPNMYKRVEPRPLTSLLHQITDDYFIYWGSVLTSSCAHVVLWILSREPFGISLEQLEEFRKLQDSSNKPIQQNNREIQPLLERNVYHVNPSKTLDSALLPIRTLEVNYCKEETDFSVGDFDKPARKSGGIHKQTQKKEHHRRVEEHEYSRSSSTIVQRVNTEQQNNQEIPVKEINQEIYVPQDGKPKKTKEKRRKRTSSRVDADDAIKALTNVIDLLEGVKQRTLVKIKEIGGMNEETSEMDTSRNSSRFEEGKDQEQVEETRKQLARKTFECVQEISNIADVYIKNSNDQSNFKNQVKFSKKARRLLKHYADVQSGDSSRKCDDLTSVGSSKSVHKRSKRKGSKQNEMDKEKRSTSVGENDINASGSEEMMKELLLELNTQREDVKKMKERKLKSKSDETLQMETILSNERLGDQRRYRQSSKKRRKVLEPKETLTTKARKLLSKAFLERFEKATLRRKKRETQRDRSKNEKLNPTSTKRESIWRMKQEKLAAEKDLRIRQCIRVRGPSYEEYLTSRDVTEEEYSDVQNFKFRKTSMEGLSLTQPIPPTTSDKTADEWNTDGLRMRLKEIEDKFRQRDLLPLQDDPPKPRATRPSNNSVNFIEKNKLMAGKWHKKKTFRKSNQQNLKLDLRRSKSSTNVKTSSVSSQYRRSKSFSGQMSNYEEINSEKPNPINKAETASKTQQIYNLTLDETIPQFLVESQERELDSYRVHKNVTGYFADNPEQLDVVEELEYLIKLNMRINNEITENVENTVNYVTTMLNQEYEGRSILERSPNDKFHVLDDKDIVFLVMDDETAPTEDYRGIQHSMNSNGSSRRLGRGEQSNIGINPGIEERAQQTSRRNKKRRKNDLSKETVEEIIKMLNEECETVESNQSQTNQTSDDQKSVNVKINNKLMKRFMKLLKLLTENQNEELVQREMCRNDSDRGINIDKEELDELRVLVRRVLSSSDSGSIDTNLFDCL